MPFIPEAEWNEHKRKVDDLKNKVDDLDDLLRHVKGALIIQGCSGKRFDLNENLNVIQVLKRITDLEARVTALE